MQSKTAMRYHFTLTRRAVIKREMTASVGKDVEKLKPHALLVGVWNNAATLESSLADPHSVSHRVTMCMRAESLQLCLTLWLCGLWPTRLLWDSPGKNTRVGYHSLLQGIFPTQGLNLCLLHCRWIPYGWVTGEGLELPYDPAIPLLSMHPAEMKLYFPHKNTYINVHTGIIHNDQKGETTHIPIKWNVV